MMTGYKLEYNDSQQEHQELWDSIKAVKHSHNSFHSDVILECMLVHLDMFTIEV